LGLPYAILGLYSVTAELNDCHLHYTTGYDTGTIGSRTE